MTPTEFKEIREGLGMSQAAIAEVLMCHVRTVQKYEGGGNVEFLLLLLRN